jgi:hypothetical protein
VKKKHNKDKKLHNSHEKLHNSHEPELTWQEKTDLSPEDDIEGGSEIYHFTDEDGNIHSREFLTEELIPDEGEVKRSPKREPRGKLQKLKRGAIDIISLVRPNEAQQHVTLPAPKSGAPPLDVRISSEVATDLFPKKESSTVGRSSKRGSEHKGCLHANHYDGLFYYKIEIKSVVQSIYLEREGTELWHFDSTN